MDYNVATSRFPIAPEYNMELKTTNVLFPESRATTNVLFLLVEFLLQHNLLPSPQKRREKLGENQQHFPIQKKKKKTIALHIQSLFQDFKVPISLSVRSKKSTRAYTV